VDSSIRACSLEERWEESSDSVLARAKAASLASWAS